ncbi:hypothetical protein CPB83DRAFT_852273 [Crepidotus variabilis]|uniref:Uncharacterized protein n=1 Tax=Crepidotus variabilis TaxID=179855 RepID=A0A9P6EIY2_9AGAR|nr:hypothetical protein CPB83DRAFT_852273 [Crepidotus variabilis]
MGSAQSYISSETAVTAVAIAGAIGFGYAQVAKSSEETITPEEATGRKGKKKKPSKGSGGESHVTEDRSTKNISKEGTSQVVASSGAIPGQFEPILSPTPADLSTSATLPLKEKKSKKKKSNPKAAEGVQSIESSIDQPTAAKVGGSKPKAAKSLIQASQSSSKTIQKSPSNIPVSQPSKPLHLSTTSIDTDDSWTRVGSRHGQLGSSSANADYPSVDPTNSDIGVSTSHTGNSSAAERTDDEAPNSFLLQQSSQALGARLPPDQNRKTLAEKILPKPRKTGVDDMLETPDYPSLSRVMRIAPLPSEKPATGFSWGDYEDVRVTTDGGENDADGEDDGWGVVTSKRPKRSNLASSSTSSLPSSAPPNTSESMTKRQRQNAQKRDKQKTEKAEAEAERLATLAKHKRELEKVRIAQQSTKSTSKTPSGGMKATIDERGKLVWE